MRNEKKPPRLPARTFYGLIVSGGAAGAALPIVTTPADEWVGWVCSFPISIPLGMMAGLLCAVVLDVVSRRV